MNAKSMQQDEFTIKNKKFQFIRLLKYFKPYLHLLLVCILLAVLMNAAVIIRPYILKSIIDDYLVPQNNDIVELRFLGIAFVSLMVVGSLFGYLQNYLLNYIGQRIIFTIRNQLFAKIQNMSMTFFDKNSSGRILTRVTNDVEALNELFSGMLINLFKDIVMIIGLIAMMFAMDVKLAAIAIGSVPIIAVITVVYRFAARKNFIRMKGMIARINGYLAENIQGMKLVQIFHREKEKYSELEKLDNEYFKSSLREVMLNSLGRPLVDVINYATVAVLIWFCTSLIKDGNFEIGMLTAFIAYVGQFFNPISEIAEQYTTIQSAVISSERIFEIMDNDEAEEDMDSGRSVEKLEGSVEFRNVWFAYNEENWVLRDVSFKITPGEMVAFVGATGSGKSTIISLIARFYDIQKGQILLDGVDIREYNLRDLRQRIAVVLQDVFLFSGDIRSNIRLNNNNITDEDIVKAAKFVSADSFIESLPGMYHEEVKERGCTFSAGQRQLISFARAVAFNPSILVLDEATANIDTETETAIQQAMVNISKGRTSIIIAHRLSTIRNADKIIVIHKGKIREMGNHEQLLQKKGFYYQLYQIQLLHNQESASA